MQIRGNLRPRMETMQPYEETVYVNLEYCSIVKDPFLTPQEAVVRLDMGDLKKEAFVPLRIVDEERSTVCAALVGEARNEIYVLFPPTNFGQTRFYATEQQLKRIAKELV